MDSSAVPKVSVIIPLYNKAPYIKRALDSVLAQTVQDFEIVVVGGNSTDGGEEIVLGYSDPRIRFVKEAGKGVSAARNQGVDAARAELVAFLDADDEWLPEFLETILRLRYLYPDAGIYGTKYLSVDPDVVSIIIPDVSETNPIISTNYFKDVNEHGMLYHTSSMVIPKTVYLSVGGFPESYAQNEDRFLRGIIALEHFVVCSPKILMIYHLDIETYHERARIYLKGTFSEYVAQNMELIADRDDLIDILYFCDSERLYLSDLNLRYNIHRDSKKIRESILIVSTPSLRLRRGQLFIMSFLPQMIYPGMDFLVKIVSRVLKFAYSYIY